MTAVGQMCRGAGRRVAGAWLLFVFLLAQAVPVVAVGMTDGMGGMACCKNGKDSCCRRKPMQAPPSFKAGNPCGTTCCGTPAVPVTLQATEARPVLAVMAVLETVPAMLVTGTEARSSAGVEPSLYQRPPPFQA